MIEARNVSFSYGRTPVLHDVSLTARHGRVLGLIGPNGSGKTTLLRTFYGSLRPSNGSAFVDGEDVARLSARELARRLAVVVQEHGGDLPLRVHEMVLLGRNPHLSMFERAREGDHRIAAAALEHVGAAHLADRPFSALSGGERQRVLLARALAQQADCLLLDEPTNHLDIRYQHEFLRIVRGLGVTSVVVLHDLNLAGYYCDDVALLDAGRLVATGTADEVLRPEVLEPVYSVHIRRLEIDGAPQLVFRPQDHGQPENHYQGVRVA
jgi:iron complex transport system ATP-binding protein